MAYLPQYSMGDDAAVAAENRIMAIGGAAKIASLVIAISPVLLIAWLIFRKKGK